MGTHKLKFTSIEGFKEDDERVIKPELNLERWGGVFVPSQARRQDTESRTLTKETRLSNGNIITDTLVIDACKYGTLTTKDQLVQYAILQLWTEQGSPLSYCKFSVHRLLQILKVKDDGGENIKSVTDSLRRLNGVTLTFIRCFYNAETNETYEDEEPIRILSEIRLKRRKKLDDGTYERPKAKVEGHFLFHSRILKNLIKNHTRPLLLDVFLSLRSDIARMIYNLLDRQITGKSSYNITTTNLFKELGLEGKKYNSVSGRKQALEKSLVELEGKQLSSGGIIGKIELMRTKNGRDYKVIFYRNEKTQKLRLAKTEASECTIPLETILEPEAPKTNDGIVSELKRLGITDTKARELVAQYPDECEKQIASLPFRDLSKVKNKAAWLITAIAQCYAMAEELEQQKQEAERKQHREAEKQAQLSCQYCEQSPGWHMIYDDKYPRGAAKPCTHDPEEEGKYRSTRFIDDERREEEPIELQEQEFVECDFCHPYAPGYHRITTTEEAQGWTLRKCSHDPAIESQFETLT